MTLRKLANRIYAQIPAGWRHYIYAIRHLGYIPNIRYPKTFNEKIGYRKRNWCDECFVICSDKIAVRDYVATTVGEQYLIEAFYARTGEVNETLLKTIVTDHGDVLVKANHNSGPVQYLNAKSTPETVRRATEEINQQLAYDYGSQKTESWYSQIKRGVLVEKNISIPGEHLLDYKFHVFNRAGNSGSRIVVQVVDPALDHRLAFFNEKFNRLPFSCVYPISRRAISKPQNYEAMLDVARSLAKPFSYVRVDLYNVNGHIYFGELTFAHQGGYGGFCPKSWDQWMGDLWTMDPAQ